MEIKIVGLAGKKGSGKDTAAGYFLDKGWARIAFADPLKDVCAYVFDIKPAKMYHPEYKDKVFEKPIVLTLTHAERLIEAVGADEKQAVLIKDLMVGMPILSIRHLLQFIGTDVVRNIVHRFYWINKAETLLKRWIEDGVSVVFTDVRFKDERELVKDYGGITVKIDRQIITSDTHNSEDIDFKCDMKIINDSSIEELYTRMQLVEEEL